MFESYGEHGFKLGIRILGSDTLAVTSNLAVRWEDSRGGTGNKECLKPIKAFRAPKDRFVPFCRLKHATFFVSDPAMDDSDELHQPACFTDREPHFKRGKSSSRMRFSAKMSAFKRMQDEEGNWAWANPIDLGKQDSAAN